MQLLKHKPDFLVASCSNVYGCRTHSTTVDSLEIELQTILMLRNQS